jgi:adenylate cyclase, class 2
MSTYHHTTKVTAGTRVEAELKARLSNPAAVRAHLDQLTTGVHEQYHDTYLDTPGHLLDTEGRELRVRTITRNGETRHLLTYKEPPVDQATQSKPEHEIVVADPDATITILTGLGYPPVLTFTKKCTNYRINHHGRDFLATLVTVPEVGGTYLEVETITDIKDLNAALQAIDHLVADLGITADELTTDAYTDAVRRARPTQPDQPHGKHELA